MMPVEFRRVDDHCYRFITRYQEASAQEVFLNFTGVINPEAYATTQQISQYLCDNKFDLLVKKKLYFQKDGRIFKLELQGSKRAHDLAQILARFFKFFKNPSKIDVEISEVSRNIKFSGSDLVFKLPTTPILDSPVEKVSESVHSEAAFSDGYTKIATEAFQKYERDFAAHDHTLLKNDHSLYRIVQKGKFLELVHSKDYSLTKEDLTLHNYKEFLIKEYGKDKVNYIAFLYKLDLNAFAPLTPEIVYRMNIGMGNIEKQDLDGLVRKLDKVALKSQEESLFNEAWLTDFTTQELRGIKEFSSKDKKLSSQNITQWLETYRTMTPGKKLKAALSILSCSSEERARQFTGKEIVYPIKSKYTLGDPLFYKPWIDQQELLHTFAFMDQIFAQKKKNSVWDAYCELLSHIVCKKHLARRHPTEDFRVGAVIPAPPDQTGKRWYVVSACISNGKGIHCYTLEPLDNEDTSLPAIKLFRSTARNSYALDNFSTIKNDFNPINSPGYEGAEFLKKYQDGFFKQRTIPLWVAYNLQVGRELEKALGPLPSPRIQENLQKAVETYKQQAEALYQPKQMKEIVHTRDAELLQLGCDLMRKSIFNFFRVCRLIVIMFRYRGQTAVSLQTQQSDMEFLLFLLKKEGNGFHGDFKIDLQLRIFINEEIRKKIGQEKKRIAKFEKLLMKGDYYALSKKLNLLARELGEHPDQKNKQSMILTGHSLGAACAQKFFIDYTAKTLRIPLEEMEISVKCFDPPAINAEDNHLYKIFGAHKSLFHDLNVKFSIIHRIEAGDFVSQGGGEHLGAASNESEQQELQEWTRFEASVSQGLKSTALPEIRDPSTVHSTRFERGRRNPTFIIHSAKKLLLQNGMDKKTEKRILNLIKERLGDYERTWVDPQILWRFNHGDQRSWKHIQTIWQEPGFLPTSVEKIRLFLGVVLRVLFARLSLNTPVELLPDAGHGNWWKHRDVNGVFAVELDKGITSVKHEKGVQTGVFNEKI